MMEEPRYSTILLFGREEPRSVISDDLFRELVESLAGFVRIPGRPLKCRGRINRPRSRNIAPRSAQLSDKLLEAWLGAIKGGIFRYFELFDKAISDSDWPAVYAGIHKLGPTAYSQQPTVGADNHVVLAMRRELIAQRMETLESYTRTLAELTSAIYGCIEYDVGWSEPKAGGLYRSDLIDMRYHDRTGNDYGFGEYTMDRFIPRLYWGNVLLRSHFASGDPTTVPSQDVARLEHWGRDLFYLRFARDPQRDSGFPVELLESFNTIPGARRDSRQ